MVNPSCPMAILSWKNFTKFTYRNTSILTSFDISDQFIFIISKNQIHQYITRTTVPLTCKLDFIPIFGCFVKDRYLLASKTHLYYFKYTLNELYPIKPLAYTFMFNDKLISIDEDKINYSNQIIKNKEKDTGMCSSHCIFQDKIFLGFESGTVGYYNDDFTKFNKLICLKDPILSICIYNDYLYVHSLSNIFRIPSLIINEKLKDEKSIIFTEIKAKKIIKTEKGILIVENMRLLLMDFDLNIKNEFIAFFEIVDVKIYENSIFIGFSNGLLIEYDMKALY